MNNTPATRARLDAEAAVLRNIAEEKKAIAILHSLGCTDPTVGDLAHATRELARFRALAARMGVVEPYTPAWERAYGRDPRTVAAEAVSDAAAALVTIDWVAAPVAERQAALARHRDALAAFRRLVRLPEGD